MIRTNPNPPMTKMDVARFGVVMRKALTKDYSPRERKRIESEETMAAKTRFSASRIKIEPLSDSEDLTQFSCGNDKLDDFFH